MDHKQRWFPSATFDHAAMTTQRAAFLEETDRILLWERLRALAATVYSKGEGGGPPIALERMLRLCALPQWCNLSAETALNDNGWMQRFLAVDFAPVLDETTIYAFHYLLANHGLKTIFTEGVGGAVDGELGADEVRAVRKTGEINIGSLRRSRDGVASAGLRVGPRR